MRSRAFITPPVRIGLILLLLGVAIGVLLLWPVGHQLRQFACDPNLMAQSPVCTSHIQTDALGLSVGRHVGLVGVLVGLAVAAILGASFMLISSGRIRRHGF
jgi:hypothetical protein